MHSSTTSTQTTMSQKRQREADTRLHGRWLLLARIAWVVIIVLSLAVSIADIPLEFARLHTICVGTSCGQQLTAGIVQELHKMNLTVDFFAACIVILDFAFFSVWVIVAFIIFWPESSPG